MEEKKSVREEARNAERLAMQSFEAKTAVLEVYTKVTNMLPSGVAKLG